ncbi:MAG: hypothetical protein GWN84_13565 [Gammaproteobacteria bacterium]|nr:hypothetical protein [Gammaproteobacteria bacterium]NIR83860.1 hypothetical protein [Gammaproteobacteria bacterium]NIR88356.1 hypothetical protein [Gammaproteobacteria bacterium]NIU05172.1 hypothetical protein [Gammaproteobacteria bacterium]NIV52001.1 hypothetical protein [Gammaproteobacteria bacterium]
MTRRRAWFLISVSLATIAALAVSCARVVQDRPMIEGKTPADFPQVPVDLFQEMDGGIALGEDEIKGRNTWMLWTAGNEAFWDYMANHSYGAIDLLKTLDSRKRGYRFRYFGLMNEPGFREASAPDEHGLWLDERVGPPPEGVDPEVYGYASGVLGLRLFPNPEFDDAAREKWDAERYYNDRSYYYDPDLVRPYRVGMSCAFCHVGPHPLNPPEDPEHPKWENLSTNVGSQYFWIGRIFTHDLEEDNFVWQLLNSSAPGALDTSFIATDNINNPRTMNAIYEVGARLGAAHVEELGGGNLDLPGVERRMPVPHILKDGADSVGILAALSRVYINIGAYHEEWIRHFNPMIGGKQQSPIRAGAAQRNSVYWQATQQRAENLARFFLKAAVPHRLEDAPGGEAYLADDARVLRQGKLVFADHCARCHSSKQPPERIAPGTPEYREWMRRAVLEPDFLDGNYLSDERRHPVSEIGTNACAAAATNALRGHIWDNFSSETYKNLPAVGAIEVQHPTEDTTLSYDMGGGGRGYYRTPSLVSVWSTAPFLHNNALGVFTNDPSVAGRMAAFEDAVHKLLWPERRGATDCAERWGMPFCPPVYRTTAESYFVINRIFVPEGLRDRLLEPDEDELRIGPIPEGTPINLIANANIELSFDPSRLTRLASVLIQTKKALARIEEEGLGPEAAREVLKELVPGLLAVNKCPDFVVDRGHEYGSGLDDDDKQALIEFLKTM